MIACDVAAQRGGTWGGTVWPPPPPPAGEVFPSDVFTFCTAAYRSVRSEALGFGWNTDWPDSGHNLMLRLDTTSAVQINKLPDGKPRQVVVQFTDKQLSSFPYVFTSDVGTAYLDDDEVKGLREYLQGGGLLHVDDFWGDSAWRNWEYEIGKVLPPDEYPIKDVPLTHPIFHIKYDVKEIPQIPSIQFWRGTRDGTTSERGSETSDPHIRAIFRPGTDQIMVLMSYNTDLADGWEKEHEDIEYYEEFSVKKAYPIGINIVVYAMSRANK